MYSYMLLYSASVHMSMHYTNVHIRSQHAMIINCLDTYVSMHKTEEPCRELAISTDFTY